MAAVPDSEAVPQAAGEQSSNKDEPNNPGPDATGAAESSETTGTTAEQTEQTRQENKNKVAGGTESEGAEKMAAESNPVQTAEMAAKTAIATTLLAASTATTDTAETTAEKEFAPGFPNILGSTTYQKPEAMSDFLLTEAELKNVPCTSRRNFSGPYPIRLYTGENLFTAACEKFDGAEGFRKALAKQARLWQKSATKPRSVRYFVLRASRQSLETSRANGLWALQTASEVAITQAFQECERVGLLFSPENSRSFFCTGVMLSAPTRQSRMDLIGGTWTNVSGDFQCQWDGEGYVRFDSLPDMYSDQNMLFSQDGSELPTNLGLAITQALKISIENEVTEKRDRDDRRKSRDDGPPPSARRRSRSPIPRRRSRSPKRRSPRRRSPSPPRRRRSPARYRGRSPRRYRSRSRSVERRRRSRSPRRRRSHSRTRHSRSRSRSGSPSRHHKHKKHKHKKSKKHKKRDRDNDEKSPGRSDEKRDSGKEAEDTKS